MFDAWLVSARLAQYLGLMTGFGLALFAWHALLREHANAAITRQTLQLAGVASAFALAGSVFGLWTMARSMSDGDAASTLATTHMLLKQTTVGATWIIRVALLGVAVGIAALPVGGSMRVRVSAVALLGAGALATLAWTGHGAMSEGTVAWLHLAVDIAHLVAAGAWLGAVLALVLITQHTAGAASDDSIRLLATTSSGFAQIGSGIVATLVVSGIVNYVLILGPSVSGLFTAPYGRLLLAKLGLFAGMLVLATANRFRFAPALMHAVQDGDKVSAVSALRRSLWTETSFAFAILILVALLGTLNPTE